MTAELFKMYKENPEWRKITKAAECLRNGGIVIYPTDTVYGMGCTILNQRSIDRLCQIKGIKSGKGQFSFLCRDIGEASKYVRNISTPVFKLMKKIFPGPYTLILEASSAVPKILKVKKKTIGIRIPDNNIILSILSALGNPIITTSIKNEDEILEYITDPGLILDEFKKSVDIIIDGGVGHNKGSTIIDCTNNKIEIIRQGLGKFELGN